LEAVGSRIMGPWPLEAFLYRGAEADIYKTKFLGEEAILKLRVEKSYRNSALDLEIRRGRTQREVLLLNRSRRMGVSVPHVWFVDQDRCLIVMEFLEGRLVRDALSRGDGDWRMIAEEMGKGVAALHNGDVVHGDLTTSNAMIVDSRLVYFDFGLGEVTGDIEGKAVDLELLSRVMHSTHPWIEGRFLKVFFDVYVENSLGGNEIMERFRRIRGMGRYVPKEKRHYERRD
jgi:TP53 regulating kinase-like protein